MGYMKTILKISEALADGFEEANRRDREKRLRRLDRELNRKHQRVMNHHKFGAVLSTLRDEIYDRDKRTIVDVVAIGRYAISGNQLDKILDEFIYDDSRLYAVRKLADKIVNPESATLSSFTYGSDRSEARKILFL